MADAARATIADHRPICRVCTRNFSQYTCPRCNLRYCSLQCYKKHSVRCTEQFARENVLEEMKDLNATPESKQKMMEALKRIHFDEEGRSVFEDEYMQDLLNGEDDDDDEEPSKSGMDGDELLSEDTLRRLQEGRGISFEDLSSSEKKAFQRAVAAGKFNHMIEPWNPWWAHPLAHKISLTKSGTQLVQPLITIESETEAEGDTLSAAAGSADIPSPPETPLQAIKELTSKQPSPLLGVHLTEAVYGYCFTLRLFNGDWESDPLDAALVLLGVSKVLGDGASPESVGAALSACLETVCSPSFKHAGGYRFGSSLFDDTSQVLRLKREGLLCALADTNRLIGQALKDLKLDTKHKSKHRSSDSRRLQTAQKKVYFMMCWVNEQIMGETFEDLVASIEKEKCTMMIVESGTRELENISLIDEVKGKKAAEEVAPTRKLLIQEVE